jgi:GNAT superfamily N-acetyltransferase
MEGVTVRELHRDFDPELLARLYRELLEPEFSPAELEAIESLGSRLQGNGSPDSLVAAAVGPDGELLGALVADYDRDCRVLLLSYLAVKRDLRGRGIGSFLLRDVASTWYESEQVLLAVGEVHDPRHWSGRGDSAAVDRLRLYDRLGALALGVPFVQPALHRDAERVPGFLLLAFHVDPSIHLRDGGVEGIPSRLVARFVRGYYEDAEGSVPTSDAEFDSLLALIEQDELVDLLELSNYERIPLT